MLECECSLPKKDAASRIESRPYSISGLADIHVPMTVSRCGVCGGELVSFAAIGRLHDYLATALIAADIMQPHHMKFVRKYLGYVDPEDFARIAQVDPSEVRRVEMSGDPIPHEWHQLLRGLVRSSPYLR